MNLALSYISWATGKWTVIHPKTMRIFSWRPRARTTPLNKIVSAELQFPVTLAGQFMEETRAVRLELFFTLDEGLAQLALGRNDIRGSNAPRGHRSRSDGRGLRGLFYARLFRIAGGESLRLPRYGPRALRP